MSQAKVVDHVLEQYVSEHHIRHPEDVAFWRRVADEMVGHAIAYMAEHPPPSRWVDDPHA